MLLEQLLEITEGVLQKVGIIANVLGRRIDLVGDASGELADGFQLLRLAELTLQYFLLGQVHGDPDQAHRSAHIITQDLALPSQPMNAAIGPKDATTNFTAFTAETQSSQSSGRED